MLNSNQKRINGGQTHNNLILHCRLSWSHLYRGPCPQNVLNFFTKAMSFFFFFFWGLVSQFLLGSKDLGTNIFRTLIVMFTNHDQNKCQSCLDSLKVCALYVKLESSGCRSISNFRPGSIDRRTGSIDRISSRMFFLQISNSVLAHLKRLEF